MSKVEIKLNRAGVRELLKSADIQAECKKHADAMVNSLGEGYEAYNYEGKNRNGAGVHTVTYEAAKENMERNTILRALK